MQNKWLIDNKRKLIMGGVILAILLVYFSAIKGGSENSDTDFGQTQSTDTAQTNNFADREPVAAETPSYELVGQSGSVLVVVIDPEDTSESRLKLLGQSLDSEYGEESIIRIGIFTDSEVAMWQLDAEKLFNLSEAEAARYDSAYVAQYSINNNTGFKSYTYFLEPGGSAKEIEL